MVKQTPSELPPDLPDGDYLMMVKSCIERVSKAGDPMWEVQSAVIEPIDVNGFRVAGSPVYDYIVFAEPKAGQDPGTFRKKANLARMTRAKVAALGLPMTPNVPWEHDAVSIEGATFVATIKGEEYEGRVQAKIARMKHADTWTGAQAQASMSPTPEETTPLPF